MHDAKAMFLNIVFCRLFRNSLRGQGAVEEGTRGESSFCHLCFRHECACVRAQRGKNLEASTLGRSARACFLGVATIELGATYIADMMLSKHGAESSPHSPLGNLCTLL